MSKGKLKVYKISNLVFDPDLYPRIKVGWLTAYQYAQAMRAGAQFPPILVGNLNGKLHVVDGWHRVEAKKILGEEFIQGVERVYASEKELFVDAIRMNAVHGRPLSVQEKVRLISKLEELKFTPKEISEIVLVPLDSIERLKVRTVVGPNGKPIYLKSVVAKATKSPEEAVEVDMGKFNVRTVQHLLMQLVELLEGGIFPLDDHDVKELAVRLYVLLGERLNLAQAR